MTDLTHTELVEKVADIIDPKSKGPMREYRITQRELAESLAAEIVSTIAEATKERGELARVKSNANHIARMDPLTTPALIARIRELEAKSAADLADYETSLETMTAAHEAKVRELEAENAKLKHDIAAYVEANSDLLEECDAALGRALEEAASLVDEYGADANHVTSNWAAQLVEALTRQGNNMSFILNHMTIPDQYYEKFTRELSEDRAALAAAEAEENRNKG